MPSGGHNKKSAAELKLHGTYRRDRHEKKRGLPTDGSPEKPTWLDPTASALWDRLTAAFPPGAVGAADTMALAAACEMWSLYRAAVAVAKQHPTDKDARISATSYLAMFNKLAGKFGLTPVDRQRLGITADAVSDDDEYFGS
jgi:P27 family predicted phage terminase small subunit